MIKRKEQWIALGKQARKQIFFYQDKALDLTHFMSEHPGGKKALANYVYKDITDIIFSVYPHKKQPTLRILMSFTIGKLSPVDIKTPKIERSLTPTKEREKKKVCFAKKVQPGANQPAEQKQDCVTPVNPAKENDNLGQSSKKKRQKSKSRQKSKDKQSKEKHLTKRQQNGLLTRQSSLAYAEDIDEQKPQFRVPVFCIKHMNEIV